jgi:hypothetical protein
VQILSSTRTRDARACQRLNKYRYLDGYISVVTAETLRFGSLWHFGQEAWWTAPTSERLERALASIAPKASDAFDLARVQALLIGYHARWSEEPFSAVAIEAQFECDLRNPETRAASRTFRLAGKIDGIIRDERGSRVLLMEHKTTSEDVDPGSNYWKRLRIDSQISIYFDGAAALGHRVESCLYDVVRKPGIRPGKVPVLDEVGTKIVIDAAGERVRTKDGKRFRQTADNELGYVLKTRDETPDEFRSRLMEDISSNPSLYFARGEVVRLESELEESRFDLWQLAQQLRESERMGRFPRNPDACVRYGHTCEFWPVCSGESSLDDPTKYKKLSNPHPELAGAVAA